MNTQREQLKLQPITRIKSIKARHVASNMHIIANVAAFHNVIKTKINIKVAKGSKSTKPLFMRAEFQGFVLSINYQ